MRKRESRIISWLAAMTGFDPKLTHADDRFGVMKVGDRPRHRLVVREALPDADRGWVRRVGR
jgi:hypothetical protein